MYATHPSPMGPSLQVYVSHDVVHQWEHRQVVRIAANAMTGKFIRNSLVSGAANCAVLLPEDPRGGVYAAAGDINIVLVSLPRLEH